MLTSLKGCGSGVGVECDSAASVSAMKKRGTRLKEEDETLCCCEYLNHQGERSHVAACCCDCEDLDEACDRLFKREPQKLETLSKVADVVTDRLRVPWLWGGARKVELTIVPPLIILPALLHLAALHVLLSVLVLTVLPVLLLWYYHFTNREKGRTLFFLSLALFSLVYMYFLFITEVFPRGMISQVQVTLVSAGVLLTLTALMLTKREPGTVRPAQELVHSTVTYYSPSSNKETKDVTVTAQAESTDDERNWCSVCRVVRPPRAGHCRICGICVLRLDHHCVWINSCVGRRNHRSFVATLVLFLATSMYGISLVLMTICPGQNLATALLYCPGVYDQHSTALCFTCSWYSTIVTWGLIQVLLIQLFNISNNVTVREARAAQREKTAHTSCCGLNVDTGVYSQGFYGNWAEFITMADKENPKSETNLV